MTDPRVAVVVAATDQFSATFGKFTKTAEQSTQRVHSAFTHTAAAGINKASGALTNFAGNILGINNQVANMAEGMAASLGVGGPVLAAIGALALGFSLIGSEARKAKKETDALIASLVKQAEDESGATLLKDYNKINAEITRLNQQIAGNLPFRDTLVQARKNVEQWRKELDQALMSLDKLNRNQLRKGTSGTTGGRSSARVPAIAVPAVDPVNILIPTLIDPAAIQAKIGEALELVIEANRVDPIWEDLRMTFEEGIANAIGGGIAAGFDGLFASGSIENGFTQLTGTLLTGLGTAAQQFGVASLKISVFMETIKKSLASFLPAGSIAASIAMIALGSALKAAGGAFASMGSHSTGHTGSSRTFGETTNRAVAEERGTVTIVLPKNALLDGSSPEFQDFLVDVMKKAGGRNVTFRPA